MGINGLLSSLRSIVTRVHISKYKGLKVGIDAHCWIYRGGFTCSKEITEGIKTTKFIHYFLEIIKLLQDEGLIPIIVFDGRPLPAKASTNSVRRESKHQNKAMAREAEADGREEDAKSLYQRSFSVTPEMVFQLIEELKPLGIEYIVSPYESDAQLAYLSLSKYVDVVITEDSDALVYGCRCVLYKLDPSGFGEEIKRRCLGANEGLSFLNWSDDQFKMMCCLSGCDYAPKIRNVGIVTAHKIVQEHKTLNRIVEALRHSKYEGITDEYIKQFMKAVFTFKHQTVYNPITKMMQPLTPFGDSFDWRLGTDYLGLILDPKTSELLASGEIHPITLEEIPKALAQPTKDTSEKTPRLEITQNSSPSRHKIEEVVWSSICAAPPQFSLPPPELDDISLDHVSPIPLSHDLIHTSPITKAKRKKKKDLDSRNSPLAIANPSFEPLQGVESLYRRKKRMSQDEEMVTEVNPWSSSKKVKNIPISSHSFWMQRNELLTPNEELSIHEALRETSRCQNRENNFIHSATDSRISQNEIDHSTLQSNTDRYRHVGILKYQPYHLFNHLSPFDLR